MHIHKYKYTTCICIYRIKSPLPQEKLWERCRSQENMDKINKTYLILLLLYLLINKQMDLMSF